MHVKYGGLQEQKIVNVYIGSASIQIIMHYKARQDGLFYILNTQRNAKRTFSLITRTILKTSISNLHDTYIGIPAISKPNSITFQIF